MGTLEITTRIGCANNCRYCPQEILVKAYTSRSGIRAMSLDLFKECLDKVSAKIRIDFSGMSEPWLNPECTAMVRYAHQRGFELAVYTTLVGVTIDDIELLRHIPFQVFEVHLPDEDGMTGITVHDRYLNTLKQVGEAGIAGLRYMTIGKVHPSVQAVVGDIAVKREIIDRAGSLSGFSSCDGRNRLGGIIRCRSCDHLLDHNVLLPNGDVALCCMDYGLRHIIGNLTSMEYRDLFASDAYRRLQESLNDDTRDALCRYCHHARRSRWNWFPRACRVSSRVKGS